MDCFFDALLQRRVAKGLEARKGCVHEQKGRNGLYVCKTAESVVIAVEWTCFFLISYVDGVPIKVALNTTFPEVVNEYNIEHLRTLIKNGPEQWPGAKYVKKQSDLVTINLKYAQNEIDKIVRAQEKSSYGIKEMRMCVDVF